MDSLPMHLGSIDPILEDSSIGSQAFAMLSVDSAVVTKQGYIFDWITGKRVAIAIAALTVIGGVAYYIYKKTIKADLPLEIKKPPRFKQFTQKQLSDISSMPSKDFQDQYQEFTCPISLNLMRQPVIIRCSHEFQKSELLKLFSSGKKACPVCRAPTGPEQMIPSKTTERSIQRFRKKAIRKGQQWVQKRIDADFEEQIKN